MNLTYTLPDLPYAKNALAPVISEEVMTLHHDLHHKAYVDGANAALERLAKVRAKESTEGVKHIMRDLSFNLNGHLLHDVFWKCMQPATENNMPSDKLKSVLETQFGSYEAFKEEFANAAKTVEGSGWAVLAVDASQNLVVNQVEKHNLLSLSMFKPILVLDVWEHAYYLDYKNKRADYVDAFWSIVNWAYLEENL